MKTTFEVKNTWDEMNVRLYMAIEKIIEPTAIAIETSQNEATVGTGHGTTDWFQIGKGVRQGYIVTLFI